MISEEPKLKPCPFCGGKAHLRDGSSIYRVRCERCDATIARYTSWDAVRDWNLRLESDNLRFLLRKFVKWDEDYPVGSNPMRGLYEFNNLIRETKNLINTNVISYGEISNHNDDARETIFPTISKLTRSDIERTVKRKVFNTRNADTLKKMFIIAEINNSFINNSFKVYCGGLCIGESLTIEEAKGIVEVFLIDFICSALGVEE